MPNYGLVINSKFKPFSYEEMLAPVKSSTEAHIELENAYSDLTTKAKTLESMLNRTTDKNEFDKYQNYLNTINSVSDDLAKNGLNAQARQNLRNLNNAYMSEIAPMQTAAQRRNEMAKLQLEHRMKDPTLFYSKEASKTGLGEFINDPNWDFLSLSGDKAKQDVYALASTLSRAYKEGDEATIKEILGGDYIEYGRMKGYTSEEIDKAINGEEGADPLLVSLVDKVVNSSGVNDWDDAETAERFRNYAAQGLWGAKGTMEYNTMANWEKQMKERHNLEVADYNRRKNDQLKSNTVKGSDGKTYIFHPEFNGWTDADGNLTSTPGQQESPDGGTEINEILDDPNLTTSEKNAAIKEHNAKHTKYTNYSEAIKAGWVIKGYGGPQGRESKYGYVVKNDDMWGGKSNLAHTIAWEDGHFRSDFYPDKTQAIQDWNVISFKDNPIASYNDKYGNKTFVPVKELQSRLNKLLEEANKATGEEKNKKMKEAETLINEMSGTKYKTYTEQEIHDMSEEDFADYVKYYAENVYPDNEELATTLAKTIIDATKGGRKGGDPMDRYDFIRGNAAFDKVTYPSKHKGNSDLTGFVISQYLN